jgi:hypothetical protein
MVEDGVAHALQILVTLFRWVLMLVIWFTLPAPHPISMKNIFDLLSHFNFGTITEEMCRGAMVNDVIREYVEKHGHALQGVSISEKQHSANKDLSIFLTTINSRDIRFNRVSSYVFIASSYIQGQIW